MKIFLRVNDAANATYETEVLQESVLAHLSYTKILLFASKILRKTVLKKSAPGVKDGDQKK